VVCKSQGVKLLGRLKPGEEDYFKVDLKGSGSECVDWILVAEDSVQWRVVVAKTVMNLPVP
jgi:hypothetical protein